jgi:hypothetical protein
LRRSGIARYNQAMLHPTPVVIDADVLLRNIEYAVKKGYPPALLGSLSGNYTLVTGVVLFATPQVIREATRHLPEVAERTETTEQVVRETWNRLVAPNVRVVPLADDAISDPRVQAVRKLHPPDAPTAALTVLVAPAVLATDNRKHFRPLGLPNVKTDAVAIDIFALGQLGGGVTAAMLFPTLAGAATIEGSKKLIAALGSDRAAVVGLMALGGVALFITSGRGQSLRVSLADAARQAAPPLMAAFERSIAAGERVAAFAVEGLGEPDALALLARRLATGQTTMTTTDIVQELRLHGFHVNGGGRLETRTRAWLDRESCFHEVSRGRWTLGYYTAELALQP